MADTIDPCRFDVIDDRMAEVLRAKTPAERLAIAHGMWSHARRMLLLVIQSDHPEWTSEQINEEAARRLSHGAV